MTKPPYRYLRGYCLDPGFSSRLDTAAINIGLYRVPFEPLEPGPVGEYIEVLDFDPASGCWYEPVDLAAEEVASQSGLAPSEGDPQFHQQFVYAVAMKTIGHFERALGRKIIWYPRVIKPPGKGSGDRYNGWRREYVPRLRIYPHALRDANAYYDPVKKALLFGYFTAAHQSLGANYPGGIVFTCLSPDIVAHEMTHAILDSIHHRYLEDTNADVGAFHEGFADIVALLQRFTFRELVEHQLDQSSGRLDRYNVFGELATQFGEALAGNRGALRSMIGRWDNKNGKPTWVPLTADPSDYQTQFESHDRGAILVATIFDAFQRVYAFRTRDLLRIATGGTGILPEGSISRDLVHRLAGEAAQIAEHLLHICIRALDYCPPHDITFGDYQRALITADVDIAPEDESGYRVALIEAFRARGIFPDRVNSLSVESLRWSAPQFTPNEEKDILKEIASSLREHVRNLLDARTREELDERSREAQAGLRKLMNAKRSIVGDALWEPFLNKLGLTMKPVRDLFGKDSKGIKFMYEGESSQDFVPKIEVHTVRPAFRAGREGRQIEQVLITLSQRVWVDIGTPQAPRPMVFRGGCTLILSLGLRAAEQVIVKNIKSYRRFRSQCAYINGETDGSEPSMSLYSSGDRTWNLDFNLLHRHI